MTPFKVQIPQNAITDLKARLALTRWPDREVVDNKSQGVQLETARQLIDHWRYRHNWRRFEERINQHPQFHAKIDDLDIHFIHVRSPRAGALPGILTHGWPGSVIEFLDSIGPLIDPEAYGGNAADAFNVVIPSIPGYGFSQHPTVAGWNAERTASAWGVLMRKLGYTHWVAQGGDWGSLITHRLAQLRPAGLAAAHVNLPLVFPAVDPVDPSDEERHALTSMADFQSDGTAYANLQGTRPQTLGYGLADSPVAQAAWMFEKIDAWSGNDGHEGPPVAFDAILDNISLYWFTNTGTSSARYYWEVFRTGFGGYSAGQIDLPMAATIFPGEFYRAPRIWAEREWTNLFYWNTVERGGHFAAWEQPKIFVEEVRKAFRQFR
ncbi:epoxide hydrolase family protein [Sphingopyxis sp. CCNWLW253]|uniref:epoxide hydrolase family protein n=1 Tax=unclassified Sphingopyxis TaxID=2614943 RepID=UPI003013138B